MENKQSSQPRSALGKGLASLLPPTNVNISEKNEKEVQQHSKAEETSDRVPGIAMVDISLIDANVFQPRREFDEEALKELSESISAKGIIQPLLVRRSSEGKRLHLIAGERRLRAAKMAGLKLVPVVLRQSSDKEALELALIENIQRENLNCIEIALSYFQLIEDFQLTQEEVAKRVGKTRSSVANHVRLLKLPEEIINDLREGNLTFGHGKALLALADSMQRMAVRKQVIEKKLSVRDTEALVTKVLTQANEEGAKKKKLDETDSKEATRHLSERLGRAYGAKIGIKGNEYKGSIVIKYFSRDDLDRLVEQLLR